MTDEPNDSTAARPDIEVADDDALRRELHRATRRGFLGLGSAALLGYAGWKWLESRPRIDGRPWPYRRILEINERLALAYYDRDRLSPTFPPSAIDPLRANGGHGLSATADPSEWRLRIEGAAGQSGPAILTLDDVKTLPRTEMIAQLRCIEGWTIVVRWTGARLLDLMRELPPPTRDGSAPDPFRRPQRLVRYVGMETPDRGYYVGLDMPAAIHPQTMLVWAMNGEPLTWRHGAPLRLAIPVKYGIKNLKRIGTIRYTEARPDDFWAKRGYDWYAGF